MSSVKEVTQKKLEKGDSLEKTFAAIYSGKNGYLAFSKMKVLFVSEKGIFRKTFNIELELPYTKIGKVSGKDYDFELAEKGGALYKFVISDVPAKAVEEQSSHLVKA